MAGIGFELKKLFLEEEEFPFANLRAIIFSIIVSVGPWLITATSLNIIVWISNQIKLARSKQLVFMSSIFYCFIFSQILTCLFQYILTRYVSDCVLKKIYLKLEVYILEL